MKNEELIRDLRECFGIDSGFCDCDKCSFRELSKESDYSACVDALGVAAADALEKSERAFVLLKATRDILKKQVGSFYVNNILAETVFYDGSECDGSCLLEDIEDFLGGY